MLKNIGYLIIIFTLFSQTQPANSKSKKQPDLPILPIELYAKLPKASQLKLSPNGDYAAYLTPVNGRTALVFHDFSGKIKPFLIPSLEDAEMQWFRWANNEYLLVSYAFTSRRNGQRFKSTRLVSFHVASNKNIVLLKPKAGSKRAKGAVGNIQDQVLDYLPKDKDNILMSIDMNGDGRDEIRTVNIKTGKSKYYSSTRLNISDWDVDQQNVARMAYGYNNKDERVIEYKNPETNKWQNAKEMPWYKKSYGFVDFDKNPRIAYMLVPNKNGVNGMVKYDMLQDKIIETLFQDEVYDAQGIKYDNSTGEVIGVTYTHSQYDVHYTDPFYKSLKTTLQKAFGAGHINILNYNRSKQVAILYYQARNVAGAYFALDMKSKQAKPLFYNYHQAIDQTLGQTKVVNITTRDNQTIEAYMTLPAQSTGKNLPTIILPHGGPHARSNASYYYEAQMLANRGYAVLQPNFRGSTGYGDHFVAAGRNQWGGLMQDDVTDATKWMIKSGISDPKRICIMGGSYGGYASLMGLVKEQDLYQCAISINGVTDIIAMRRNDAFFIGGRAWSKSWGLDGSKDREISPYHQSDKITKPVLLIHSKDDTRVPYNQSKKMQRRLKNKVDAKYIQIEYGGHSLETEAARLESLKAIESFLKKHLPTSRNN